MMPFEISIHITNSREGYVVMVVLESKDSTNPITITKKKIYADLNDFTYLKQEVIDEYYQKMSEL